MPAQPTIELLYWGGCPSHPRALAELREAMAAMGLDPDTVFVREVNTDDLARRERFVGSPTIRVDGVDIAAPPEEEPYGLTCRVYYSRDGRVVPVPDRADVDAALERAMTERSHQ